MNGRQKLIFDSWAKFHTAGFVDSNAGLFRRQSRSVTIDLNPDEGIEVVGADVSGDQCGVCNCNGEYDARSAGGKGGVRTVESEEGRSGVQKRCIPAAEDVVLLTVDGQFVACSRSSLAELSAPFHAMLMGQYQESRKTAIPFDLNGLSPAGKATLIQLERL